MIVTAITSRLVSGLAYISSITAEYISYSSSIGLPFAANDEAVGASTSENTISHFMSDPIERAVVTQLANNFASILWLRVQWLLALFVELILQLEADVV